MVEEKWPALSRAAVVALVAAGSLVVAVLGAVGVTLVRAEEAPEPEPRVQVTKDLADPADTVEDLVDAAEDDDCAAVDELVAGATVATRWCASPAWSRLGRDDVDDHVGQVGLDGADEPEAEGGLKARIAVAVVGERSTQHYAFVLTQVGDGWLATSFRRDTTGVAGPDRVLDSFFHAVFTGDCDLATTYATEAYLDRQGQCIATGYSDEELAAVRYDFGRTRYDGGRRAVVPVTLTNGADVSTGDWELVVQDREWRVARLPG